MGYAVGFRDGRFIGYGVPAECDKPECEATIDRGMGYICGDVWGEPDEEGRGCGLFFCADHGGGSFCIRCQKKIPPYTPKDDTKEWADHVLTDSSWAQWREENPERTEHLKEISNA